MDIYDDNVINTCNLLKGDCLELIKNVPDKSIDLVIIDPPYVLETDGAGFFGKKDDDNSNTKGKKDDKWGGQRYVMKEINTMKNGIDDGVLDELCRTMKKINCYIWCSQKQLIPLLDYFVTRKKCNWNLITWHKSNPIPTCGNKYLSDTEYCLFFREKGVKVYGTFNTKFTYYVTTLNKIDKNKYGHPTIKPLDIIENLVTNSSQEGDTVLDCFMGSGTTGVACKKLNHNFIGMEIDEKYFNIAQQRIHEQFVNKNEEE